MNDEKWIRLINLGDFRDLRNYAFSNDYAVSNYGRFYSEKTDKFIKGHFHKSRSGIYIRVQFERIRLMAHVVVCNVFNEFPEHLKHEKNVIVNHKNGNTLDNRADNLEFITQSDNVKHFHFIKQKPRLIYEC